MSFNDLKTGRLIKADCLTELKDYPSNSIDLIITDPPYGLSYCGLDWDKKKLNLEIWEECRRVLKPGAFIFVMSSVRQDVLCNMILNLQNAGFDTEYTSLYWTYNTGFPKARNIGKTIDRAFGMESNDAEPCSILGKKFKDGYAGFQPKPAVEAILIAMKPLTKSSYASQAQENNKGMTYMNDTKIPIKDSNQTNERFMSNLIVSDNALDLASDNLSNAIECSDNRGNSFRFSLDAWAEKTLPHLLVAKPSLVEKELGLDDLKYEKIITRDDGQKKFNVPMKNRISDRKNTHPTVKPLKLMSYLVVLGSQPGDIILDPFCGTGTTCVAAMILGRKFIGIENDEKSFKIAKEKLKNVKGKIIKKKKKSKPRTRKPSIISVSRRTDIPAFYSDWFFNRIKEGFVQVRKKADSKTIKKVSLLPEDVRCFVFWTKNPEQMLKRLDELKAYNYYFHFTLTPYDNTLEQFLPPKKKLVKTFIQLSKKIGKEKVIWRYDPILLNADIDIEHHKREFENLAKSLQGYTEKCIISFIDTGYIAKEIKKQLKLKKISKELMREIGKEFQSIAEKYKLKIETCAEKIDLTEFGIFPSKCIDDGIIGTLIGENLSIDKDPAQRKACDCVKSIDIGTDETCTHGCLFCYATKNSAQASLNYRLHNKKSPLLIGKIE